VRGIELCAACLTARKEDPAPIIAFTPGRVTLARLRFVAAREIPGFVAGAVVGWLVVVPEVLSWAPKPIDVAMITLVTGLVGALLVHFGLLFFLARLQFAGSEAWKRSFIEALKIPPDHSARFRVVLARVRGKNPLAPERGVVAHSEGGLVFIGKRGTRLAISAPTIMSVDVPRWSWSWPVRPLRLALASGETWDFGFQEGKTLRAASALADEAAARLRGRP
jgi:hypothetical protein